MHQQEAAITTVHLYSFLSVGFSFKDSTLFTLNIKMRTLCMLVLFHASLQLQCERSINAHIGGELVLFCTYNANHFRFSKKYWCRGDYRSTCEILVDSDGIKNTHRSHIIDAGRRGLLVKVTNLQFDDTGVYWVGIDKMSSDIMTKVNVVITEVPVSRPRLWPLSSLADRPTCWGKPLIVRCGCTKGTDVRYTWYQHTADEERFLHHSSDLSLQCGTVHKGSDYYCTASNDVSSQGSDILSVQVLMPADSSCIYVVNMQGQPVYDCDDRMSSTTAKSPPLMTCQTTVEIHSDNQSDQRLLFSRAWTGLPFWYTLLRWGCFASLLLFLCIVMKCTNAERKRKRRKRVRPVPQLAQ